MRLHVGCAQWTHAGWAQPSRDKLRSYASWCNAVESNTTFYATPSQTTVAGWAAQTPPDFRFVVKLPQLISHERRLSGVEVELRAFLSAMEPLADRNHAVWIQLPASFSPTDLGTLAAFLHQAPRGLSVRRRGPPPRVLRRPANGRVARAGPGPGRRGMGPLRHGHALSAPADKLRRTRCLDEEAPSSTTYSRADRTSDRPLYRPGRRAADCGRVGVPRRLGRELAG